MHRLMLLAGALVLAACASSEPTASVPEQPGKAAILWTLLGPLGSIEAIIAAEAGYYSRYNLGWDALCFGTGGSLPRDPVDGACTP